METFIRNYIQRANIKKVSIEVLKRAVQNRLGDLPKEIEADVERIALDEVKKHPDYKVALQARVMSLAKLNFTQRVEKQPLA